MIQMKKENMPNGHLHELFVEELKDMLGGERQLLKGLKKMATVATSSELKEAFQTHYEQTEEHVKRLQSVFDSLGMTARGKKCKAMEGLLSEAEEIIENFEDSPEVLNAALIVAAQKIEHYEIASYGSLATFASLMDHEEAKQLLGETLDEEKETDALLTELAMNQVNQNEEI